MATIDCTRHTTTKNKNNLKYTYTLMYKEIKTGRKSVYLSEGLNLPDFQQHNTHYLHSLGEWMIVPRKRGVLPQKTQ